MKQVVVTLVLKTGGSGLENPLNRQARKPPSLAGQRSLPGRVPSAPLPL